MQPELDAASMLETLSRWEQAGWLRPLDLAFVRFLHEQAPATEAATLLAGALASYQLRHGHICLDLSALSDPAWLTEADTDREGASERQEAIKELQDLLAGMKSAQWKAALCKPGQPVSLADKDSVSDSSPLVLDEGRLYLRRYWQYEQTVLRQVHARLAQQVAVPVDLHERLSKLFPHESSARPDWQRIACALAARGAFTLITGGPGTGKTTTVVRLLALLQSASLEGLLADPNGTAQPARRLRIRLAAPTGKAAARLTESIGSQVEALDRSIGSHIPTRVQTLHQLLGVRPGARQFRHRAGNPLHVDLLVVDEASMIDLEMMAALLAALPPESRLVLLGDSHQLASVEAGSVLGDLARQAGGRHYSADTVAWLAKASGEDIANWQGSGSKLADQTVMLQYSHRFAADSGIGQLARAVNAGDDREVESLLARAVPNGDIRHLSLKEAGDARLLALCIDGAVEGPVDNNVGGPVGYGAYLQTLKDQRPPAGADTAAIDSWARAVLEQYDRFQLLAAVRQGPWGVAGLNERIARALHDRGLIPATEGWYEGRPVLVTRNDYALGLMNGDIGITLSIPDDEGATRLRVVFPLAEGGLRYVLPGRLTATETVYVLTVHKSQGSEFEHAAMILPDTDNPVLSRELIYTGVTRARRWFSLLAANPAVLSTSVSRCTQRASGLGDRWDT